MTIDLRFVSTLPDRAVFHALMIDYYNTVLPGLHAIGGPDLSATTLADDTMDHLDELLPPENRLVLGWNADGGLVACGTLRRIRRDAVEMKRMFVRPKAQGTGLGKRLFDMRLDEARKMGCTTVYADTYKGNRPMLRIYEKYGFSYIPRYPENANPAALEPYLVYLEYRFETA